MDGAELLVALAAGVLTFFSPCAFAMFPAYLAYLISLRPSGGSPVRAGALAGALAGASASLTLFAIGIASSLTLSQLMELHHYAQLVTSLALLGLGAALLAGVKVAVPFSASFLRRRGGFYTLSVIYGVAYALVSLSCSLPVFAVVVAVASTRGGVVGAATALLAYVAGLSAPMVVVAVVAAMSREAVAELSSRVLRHVDKLSGLLLLVAGAYMLLQCLQWQL